MKLPDCLEFKPEDFKTDAIGLYDPRYCAIDVQKLIAVEANRLLLERVNQLPDVYTTSGCAWLIEKMGYYKKRGKVICIEESSPGTHEIMSDEYLKMRKQ